MKDLRHAIWEVIKRFFCAVLSTAGVFIAFGWILERLENIIHTRMMMSVGQDVILVTGVVGTPLHEIAHWIGCKIFGFTVIDVDLLRPVAYKYDGILGYVRYSTSINSWWNKLGCFVTGMAPMILGSVFMMLIVRFVVPEVFESTKKSIEEKSKGGIPILSTWWAAFVGFWKGMISLRKWGILRGILCLYLVMSTSMHMTVSGPDIQSASVGFGIVAIIYLAYSIITAAIGNEYVMPALKRGGFIASLLSIGLISDGIVLLISLFF